MDKLLRQCIVTFPELDQTWRNGAIALLAKCRVAVCFACWAYLLPAFCYPNYTARDDTWYFSCLEAVIFCSKYLP
jgi:hypothetical protein